MHQNDYSVATFAALQWVAYCFGSSFGLLFTIISLLSFFSAYFFSIFRWTCSCVFMFVYQHRVIIFSSKLFFFSAVDWARFVPFVCPLWAAEAISLPRRISLLHSLLAIIYSQSMLFLFRAQQHTEIALLPFIIFLVHVANKIYRSILSNVCLRSCSFAGVSAAQ